MNRQVKDKNILNDFCSRFCKILEKHCRYIVVSGFVAIASGRARGTEDIDVIIERIGKPEFIRLHNNLIKSGFVCMQSDSADMIYADYLANNDSVRYTFKDMPLPEMELKLAKDELDNLQLQNRQKIKEIGLDVWFSPINFNIAFKEEYLKSDKDIEDAVFLRKIYKDKISEERIDEIKKLIRRHKL